MSRSPLLGALRRAIARARRAPGAGHPRIAPPGLTRRALLARGAALAGAAALAGCMRSAPARPSVVAIVGAGLAGLTCAHELERRGVHPILLEAGARLGGRVLSDTTTFAPAVCELGGEFIDSDHATMLRLARELEIALIDLAPDKAHAL